MDYVFLGILALLALLCMFGDLQGYGGRRLF